MSELDRKIYNLLVSLYDNNIRVMSFWTKTNKQGITITLSLDKIDKDDEAC